MKNIKGFAVASDGNMKRIAITFDEISDTGKVINSNVKMNRIITDETCLLQFQHLSSMVRLLLMNRGDSIWQFRCEKG